MPLRAGDSHWSLGRHVPDEVPPGAAGEAAVGDQCDRIK
jgi:hypothetical protein